MPRRKSSKAAATGLLAEQLELLLESLEGARDPAVKEENVPPLQLPTGVEDRFQLLANVFSLNSFEQVVLAVALAQEVFPVRTRILTAEILGLGTNTLSATLTPSACLQWADDTDPLVFSEDRALFDWGLLRFGSGLTPDASMRTLTVAPGVMMFLQGHNGIDPELASIADEFGNFPSLSESQAKQLAIAQEHFERGEDDRGVLFYGTDAEAMRALTGHLLQEHGRVLQVDIAALASRPAPEFLLLLRAFKRDLRLKGFQAALNATGQIEEVQALDNATQSLLNVASGHVAVMANTPMPINTARALLTLEVHPPTPAEQRQHWSQMLGIPENLPLMYQLGDQFRLGLDRIASLANETRKSLPKAAAPETVIERAWDTARTANRRLMGTLADRINSRTTWHDLILPESDMSVLQQISMHVRHRSVVYEQLGMARAGRGRALTALFSGPSGTGKTLSAEVLANDLQLDLYRIDLSNTVSKYIGETEKNLKRIFDAADQGGCILLFDEADSVFGKRGEVKDSNDRYANIQVNYLLQRLESFNGLAILTTNMESSMDIAFMRRIQFVLNFRPPTPADRERLWRLAFPSTLDTTDLDFSQLAKADVAGGNIRSIAMNAVFMAVASGRDIDNEVVNQALQLEYKKLGRLVLPS
ncbi:ATP-dependent zinc metalloprotease FtsH [Deinococcus xinjiangensis]|uniref:ATP-dependent zinc metalloprotease FtsH n=1 Tax=Deinococcus xinjiangensis TaxID=457454 RepID=A0ABP9VHD9_9DEIO